MPEDDFLEYYCANNELDNYVEDIDPYGDETFWGAEEFSSNIIDEADILAQQFLDEFDNSFI